MTEQLDGFSRRNITVSSHKNKIDKMLASTAEDGSIPTNSITSLDYRLGNLCNLQCRMCNPHSTKLWIKDWNEMKSEKERLPQHMMETFNKYDWIDSPNLVKDFEMKASGLEHVHFAGGEPLIVPQMVYILQKCIAGGNAKNIILTYNTNLTILPKKVLELWKEFKGVKILASIDGIGDLNYYIRYPAKWDQIEKNLQFIEDHHKEYHIKECMLSTTVQILNIMHLPRMFDYLSKYKFIVKAPNLVNLHFPTYFQTSILPEELKNRATAELTEIGDKLMTELPSHFQYLAQNIKAVLAHMNKRHPHAEREFHRFVDFQMKFDAKKKLSIKNYCPEFSPFF